MYKGRQQNPNANRNILSNGKLGSILVIISLTCITVAFFTSYWLQNNRDSTFARMGLWMRCAQNSDIYSTGWTYNDGECRWIIDPFEYPLIYLAIQILFTTSWIMLILTTIRLTIFIIRLRSANENCSLATLGKVLITAAICGATAVIMFGVMVANWRDTNNFPSWSFALAATGVLGECAAGYLFIKEERNQNKQHYQVALHHETDI